MFKFEKPKEFSNSACDAGHVPESVCLLAAILFPVLNFTFAEYAPFRKLVLSFCCLLGGFVSFTCWAWLGGSMTLVITALILSLREAYS
jgi:hypothetical protein